MRSYQISLLSFVQVVELDRFALSGTHIKEEGIQDQALTLLPGE